MPQSGAVHGRCYSAALPTETHHSFEGNAFMFCRVTTRHAICAALYLALNGKGRSVQAKEISKKKNIPMPYLSRILGKMVKEGLLRSNHGGRERGYRLSREADSISLFDILDIFEGWSTSRCRSYFAKDEFYCMGIACLDAIECEMLQPLKQITLGILASDSSEREVRRILGRPRPSVPAK
jgi:Rrf2 family protein